MPRFRAAITGPKSWRLWLKNLKACIDASTAVVDYMELSPYNMTCDAENIILALKFDLVASDVDIAEAKFNTEDYGVKNVWLDLQATLCKPHVAPTKLESFFSKGKGPKKLESVAKSGVLEQYTNQAAGEFQKRVSKAKRDTIGDGSKSSDSGIANQIVNIQKSEKIKKMDALKIKSRETMSAANAKKVLSVKTMKKEA